VQGSLLKKHRLNIVTETLITSMNAIMNGYSGSIVSAMQSEREPNPKTAYIARLYDSTR